MCAHYHAVMAEFDSVKRTPDEWRELAYRLLSEIEDNAKKAGGV